MQVRGNRLLSTRSAKSIDMSLRSRPWQGARSKPGPMATSAPSAITKGPGSCYPESSPEIRPLILPNGEWLCAARSQKRDEQAIYLCRSQDNGRSWSEPVRVTEAKEHPPDLVLLSDGTILLNFGVRHEPFSVQGMVSRDFGHTWLKTRLLYADDLPGTDIGYPSTVRLTNGKLITVYYRAGSKNDQSNGPNPACLAVCYDEKVLLKALEKLD